MRISSYSVASTSPETGPGTSFAISCTVGRYARPDFAISDGIGGDAVDHAPFEAGLDLFDFSGIEKEFHG